MDAGSRKENASNVRVEPGSDPVRTGLKSSVEVEPVEVRRRLREQRGLLGLAGESGEVADHIKKLLRDDWLDRAGLVDELGDVIYYWACLCAATGQKPSELLKASAAKISRRLGEAASR